MRTTINELVDRRGGAYSTEELEKVLERARRILADTSALLELQIDGFFNTDVDTEDKERVKAIRDLITQTHKGMQMILDIEAKAGLSTLAERNAMNLEVARAEILRRLSRLVAREGPSSVPG